MGNFGIVSENLLCEGPAQGMSVYAASIDDDCDKVDEFGSLSAITPEQTHSLNVAIVENRWSRYHDVDALITFKPDISIGVFTADCVPVLVYAPDISGVAAIHAGWKGTLGGIVDNTLDVLVRKGASPAEMFVAFGPSISKKRYEVDRELADRFMDAGFGEYVSWPDGDAGKPHIDLQGVNMERLLRRGVKRENIALHYGCTYDSVNNEGKPIYYSHRRSHGAPGRILTSIMLLDSAVERK